MDTTNNPQDRTVAKPVAYSSHLQHLCSSMARNERLGACLTLIHTALEEIDQPTNQLRVELTVKLPMELTNQTIIDHAIPLVQRILAAQLREVAQGFTHNQKIGAAQVIIYQASRKVGLPYTLLIPKEGFDEKIKKVFAIAELLPVEALLDLAIKILIEPTDQNG